MSGQDMFIVHLWHLKCMLDAESVDNLMNDSHELGGSTVVVDRATPKVSRQFLCFGVLWKAFLSIFSFL